MKKIYSCLFENIKFSDFMIGSNLEAEQTIILFYFLLYFISDYMPVLCIYQISTIYLLCFIEIIYTNFIVKYTAWNKLHSVFLTGD